MIVQVWKFQNDELQKVGIIEDYRSLIWTTRYYEAGDFEMVLPATYDKNPLIDYGNFLMIEDDPETVMIIEAQLPSTTDNEDGILISGESYESIFKRRVLRYQRFVTGAINKSVDGIMSVIQDNTNGSIDTERHIESLAMIQGGLIDIDYTTILKPGTLYDIIVEAAKDTGVGIKCFPVVSSLFGNRRLMNFRFYRGVDRSFAQTENDFVIFSPKYDNVLSSSYQYSTKDTVTFVYVMTRDDPTNTMTEVWIGSKESPGDRKAPRPEPTDLDRYEVLVDIQIDRNPEDGVFLTDEQFIAVAEKRGREELLDNKLSGIFDGQFDIQGNFKYGEDTIWGGDADFYMGDIVQMVIEDRQVTARIIEVVRSFAKEGNEVYASFKAVSLTQSMAIEHITQVTSMNFSKEFLNLGFLVLLGMPSP